jgi:hypothetical protein
MVWQQCGIGRVEQSETRRNSSSAKGKSDNIGGSRAKRAAFFFTVVTYERRRFLGDKARGNGGMIHFEP